MIEQYPINKSIIATCNQPTNMPPHSLNRDSSHEYDDRDDSAITSTTVSGGISSIQPKLSLTRSSSFTALEMVAECDPVVTVPIPTLLVSSSALMIRSRLLNRLGISSRESEHRVPRTSESCDILRRGRTLSFEETLKADFGRPDRNLIKNNKQQTVVSGGSDHSSISFNAVVRVHTIPTRTEYSARIRGTLWTHPLEMQQNAARNSLEFAAEGWDWRNVADDEDMVICAGERIHPIHFVPCDKNSGHISPS
jgi:hypothetical protein